MNDGIHLENTGVKQAAQERHQKMLYYRQVKKLSIRETADATGYIASVLHWFAGYKRFIKILNRPEKL